MKKIALLHGNCQSDGIAHFLKKTRMGDEYEFHIWHNWQLGMLEQSPAEFMADLPRADVFIYQPCRGFPCGYGGHPDIPPTDVIVRDLLPKGCISVSYAYQFNHGFFPLTNFEPDKDGWIQVGLLKANVWGPDSIHTRNNLFRDYNAGTLNYACAKRFIECAAEQSRREDKTDIKMIPWILQNFTKQRLFLTMNHPTSAFFSELAYQVMARTELRVDERVWDWTDENEARMNGVMPVHQAAVNELGLEYPASEGAHEYYRAMLEKLAAAK